MSDFSDTNILRKIFNAIPGILKPVLIRGQRQRWRDDFSGNVLSSDWQVIQIGNGQSITVADSELKIAAGNLVGKTIIRHKKAFTIPYKVAFIAKVNSKIANQQFCLEIVDSSGNNFAKYIFSGTTVTSVSTQVQNNGTPSAIVEINTPIATSFYNGFEIDANVDELKFSTRDLSGTNGRIAISSVYQKIPDPSLEYFIQIQAENTAQVPSNTTLTLDSVAISENEIIATELIAARGSKKVNDSIPVTFTNTSINVNNTASVIVTNNSLSVTSNSALSTETITALLANATFTTQARDTIGRRFLKITVQTDQPGNCFIDQSIDAVTWLDYGAKACTVGINTFSVEMSLKFFRIRYVNGSTAQSLLRIYSSMFSI